MTNASDSSAKYTAPVVTDLGTLSEHTLETFTTVAGNSDVIVINGQSINVPGSGLVP